MIIFYQFFFFKPFFRFFIIDIFYSQEEIFVNSFKIRSLIFINRELIYNPNSDKDDVDSLKDYYIHN